MAAPCDLAMECVSCLHSLAKPPPRPVRFFCLLKKRASNYYLWVDGALLVYHWNVSVIGCCSTRLLYSNGLSSCHSVIWLWFSNMLNFFWSISKFPTYRPIRASLFVWHGWNMNVIPLIISTASSVLSHVLSRIVPFIFVYTYNFYRIHPRIHIPYTCIPWLKHNSDWWLLQACSLPPFPLFSPSLHSIPPFLPLTMREWLTTAVVLAAAAAAAAGATSGQGESIM